jgi:hypothetical protein
MWRIEVCVGAVLHQGGGPIAFFSSQIAQCHSKLAVYERELIGLVQAIRHWRRYLWGKAFIVKTDHFSLKYLLDQRLATILQHQWVSKLMGFDLATQWQTNCLTGMPGKIANWRQSQHYPSRCSMICAWKQRMSHLSSN